MSFFFFLLFSFPPPVPRLFVSLFSLLALSFFLSPLNSE